MDMDIHVALAYLKSHAPAQIEYRQACEVVSRNRGKLNYPEHFTLPEFTSDHQRELWDPIIQSSTGVCICGKHRVFEPVSVANIRFNPLESTQFTLSSEASILLVPAPSPACIAYARLGIEPGPNGPELWHTSDPMSPKLSQPPEGRVYNLSELARDIMDAPEFPKLFHNPSYRREAEIPIVALEKVSEREVFLLPHPKLRIVRSSEIGRTRIKHTLR